MRPSALAVLVDLSLPIPLYPLGGGGTSHAPLSLGLRPKPSPRPIWRLHVERPHRLTRRVPPPQEVDQSVGEESESGEKSAANKGAKRKRDQVDEQKVDCRARKSRPKRPLRAKSTVARGGGRADRCWWWSSLRQGQDHRKYFGWCSQGHESRWVTSKTRPNRRSASTWKTTLPPSTSCHSRQGQNPSELCKAAKQSDVVYLAPDPDREGEAIVWHLADEIRTANENIKRVLLMKSRSADRGDRQPTGLDRNKLRCQQTRRA